MKTIGSRSVIASLVLVLVAALAVACGGGTPTPTPSGGGQQPTPTPTPDEGFDAEAHFARKTITLVINSNPGGGTDSQGRLVADRIGAFIPGNPRVVVSNQPNKNAAHDYIGKDVRPDGLTLGWFGSADIERGFYDNIQVRTDEFKFIGTPNARNAVWMSRGDLGYDCLIDAAGSSGPEFTTAATATSPDEFADVLTLGPAYIADVLNIPYRVFSVAEVTTSGLLLMIERGEINTMVRGPQWFQLPVTRPGWVSSGFIKYLGDLSHPSNPAGANAEAEPTCPNVREYLTGEQLDLFEALASPGTFADKTMYAPPATPPEIVEVLREAFRNLMADPQFIQDFTQVTGQEPMPLVGEEGQQVLAEVTAAYERNLDRITQVQNDLFEKTFR